MAISKISGNMIDGSLTSSLVTGSLPAVDGSALTGASAGIDTETTSDPLITTNPSATGHLWVNKNSGEMFVCTDKTAGANVWYNIGRGSGDVAPYSFQGTGFEGLEMFREAADNAGLPIVTELLDVRHLDKFLEQKVDVIQIGTRSMQNFELLREVGRLKVPVILKRGMSATISEWLMAAEYIASGGNHNIIFCERGIRTFETYYRNVLDVTAIPVLKKETHLPVIIDPSHAGGKAWMVAALSRAGIAAGADGLLVEMHPTPSEAWCDADQAITPTELQKLMKELSAIANILGRDISK